MHPNQPSRRLPLITPEGVAAVWPEALDKAWPLNNLTVNVRLEVFVEHLQNRMK